MGYKIMALAIIILFATLSAAVAAALAHAAGVKWTAAVIAGGSAFGGAFVVGVSILNFLFS